MQSVVMIPSKTLGKVVAMNIIRPSMIAKHMKTSIIKYIKWENDG
jgi:hypothetical protein